MEKIFFEYEDVKVTNARFINGANTYAMAGITSIKLREKKPSMTDVVICILISLAALINALGGNYQMLVPALLMALLAFYLYKKKQTIYAIILATSGGETEGLISNQKNYTTQVVNALNEAVIYRE